MIFGFFGVPQLPPICSWVKNIFRNLPPFFMGEKYFQEFASIFFMGDNYFRNLPPILSWVKNIFRNLPPFFHGWGPRGPTHLGPGLGPGAAAAAGAAACAAGRILRSQPDPSPNAPRDQIRRKDPCCDLQQLVRKTRVSAQVMKLWNYYVFQSSEARFLQADARKVISPHAAQS